MFDPWAFHSSQPFYFVKLDSGDYELLGLPYDPKLVLGDYFAVYHFYRN